MAFLDKLNEFCDATSLICTTTAAGVLGNVIDLGGTITGSVLSGTNSVQGYPGNSDDVYFVARILTAITSDGTSANTFYLMSHTTATLTGGTVHATATCANAAAGTVLFNMELPRGTYQRYLGIYKSTITGDITAGTLDAYLTLDAPTAWTPTADLLVK